MNHIEIDHDNFLAIMNTRAPANLRKEQRKDHSANDRNEYYDISTNEMLAYRVLDKNNIERFFKVEK
jgi:hypothetical protein